MKEQVRICTSKTHPASVCSVYVLSSGTHCACKTPASGDVNVLTQSTAHSLNRLSMIVLSINLMVTSYLSPYYITELLSHSVILAVPDDATKRLIVFEPHT